MREALKNVFGKEVILEDGTVFLFTIQPYEMRNMLEQVVAVLDEYAFTEKGRLSVYKLYRTNDGNWYEINQCNKIPENNRITALKLAINKQEEHLNLGKIS